MAIHPAKIADLDDVTDLARGLSDPFLRCRLGRHFLDEESPYAKVMYSRKHRTYDESGPCMSCGATIHNVYSDNGEIISHRIDYPEGYLLEKGTGRIDTRGRTILRRERLERRRRALRVVKAAG